MEVVHLDAEVLESADELLRVFFCQLLGCHAEFTSLDHDRRAMRIGGAHVDALVPAQFLEANPDVGLDVLDHVAHVRQAVHVRQGTGDQDFSFRVGSSGAIIKVCAASRL